MEICSSSWESLSTPFDMNIIAKQDLTFGLLMVRGKACERRRKGRGTRKMTKVRDFKSACMHPAPHMQTAHTQDMHGCMAERLPLFSIALCKDGILLKNVMEIFFCSLLITCFILASSVSPGSCAINFESTAAIAMARPSYTAIFFGSDGVADGGSTVHGDASS